jgi:hypothetical protein
MYKYQITDAQITRSAARYGTLVADQWVVIRRIQETGHLNMAKGDGAGVDEFGATLN